MANNKIEGGVWAILSREDESDEYCFEQLAYWNNNNKLWHTSFFGQQFILEYNDGAYHIQSQGQDFAISKPCLDTDKHIQFDYIEAFGAYFDLIHIGCPTSGAFECFDSNGGIIIPYNGVDNLYGILDISNINLESIDKRYKQYSRYFKDLNNFAFRYTIFINQDDKFKYDIESRIDSPSLYMTKLKHVDYNMFVNGCKYQDEYLSSDGYMVWHKDYSGESVKIKYLGSYKFELCVNDEDGEHYFYSNAEITGDAEKYIVKFNTTLGDYTFKFDLID